MCQNSVFSNHWQASQVVGCVQLRIIIGEGAGYR